MKARGAYILLGSWLITILLFTANGFANLEVDYRLRVSVILLNFAMSILLLWHQLYSPYSKQPKYVMPLIGSIMVCLTLFFLLSSDGAKDWKTQTILFEHGKNRAKIEFQLKDIGSRGYLRRTVEVTRYLFVFSTITEVNTDKLDGSWKAVNRHINEMELKGG